MSTSGAGDLDTGEALSESIGQLGTTSVPSCDIKTAICDCTARCAIDTCDPAR